MSVSTEAVTDINSGLEITVSKKNRDNTGQARRNPEPQMAEQATTNEPKKKSRIWMLCHKGYGIWRGAGPGEKLMAALTLAIILISGLQWDITRGQLKQSRADSELEYRPWVAVIKTYPQVPTPGKKVECTFEIMNAGRTPAIHVEAAIDYFVGPEKAVVTWKDSPIEAWPSTFLSRALILPSSEVVCTHVSSEAFEKMPGYVVGRNNWVYALVRITYTPLSDEKRRYMTRQAFIFDPSSKSLTAYDKYTDMI